jgi:hypothetical protein
MNTAQAKQLSLPDLLSRLGHEPVREEKGGRELWYLSPFRTEKEASFHTSFLGGKWIWKDFGDIGGTVIDFALRHQNGHSIQEALIWLEGITRMHRIPRAERVGEGNPEQTTLFSFQQQGRAAAPLSEEEPNAKLELLSTRPVSHPVILSYLLEERRLPLELIRRYLREITYRNTENGREYFAFGMENESGGYEIRVASSKLSFKSALRARDITVIQGTSPERGTVNVFEGMTDFLSLLAMMKFDNLAGDTVILHSLTSFPRAAEFIRTQDYRAINTFLDNDLAGKEGTETFQAEFGDKVAPQNNIFAGYKDLNDALRANQTVLQPPMRR